MSIICGSKPYKNINFNNLIDNYYTKIYRINMNIPNDNSIYGKRNSNYQYLNLHVYEKYKNKFNLHNWLSNYKLEKPEHIEKFYDYINNNDNKNTFYQLNDPRSNNTKLINNILLKYKSQYRFKNKISRCGLGLIAQKINDNDYPTIIGFSLINDTLDNSYYRKENIIGDCHDAELEKKIIVFLHDIDLIDATLSSLKDYSLPLIDCNILKPKINSLINILKCYGICIFENFYNEEYIIKFNNEFEKIFLIEKNKIQILDKEDCSNDERIFNCEKYSEFIKDNFSNNNFLNQVALNFTNKSLNKKTLINKIVYEDGKVKNSGAGWHRDNHECQFKALLYLNDVHENNGCFQFISNSSKNHIGFPKPRTNNYNTRFHDNVIEDILNFENNECKLYNITGKAGTLLLVDTTYIHRGNIIKEGKRYAITQYFI